MSETLDPLRVPLWGSRLIEASAGTGKTWTIAGLYLRLVLGHGDAGAAFARPLVPAEILVMTFTVAATRELSDRIRARLVEAARCFRGEREPSADDPFLRALISDHAPGEARAAAAWRLAMAAEAMDDAAVHTIDAWCQRMLREHAFDSGSLFDEELLADEFAFVDEAARDYWRRNIYPLTGASLDRALAVWPDVGSLIADVRALRSHAVGEGGDGVAAGLSLDAARLQAEAACGEAVQHVKAGWVERTVEMREWLGTQLGANPSLFNGKKLKASYVADWCEALGTWAASQELVQPGLTKAAWNRLSPDGLQDARKGPEPLALPPWSADFAPAARSDRHTLPVAGNAMRMHAAANVRSPRRRAEAQCRHAPAFSTCCNGSTPRSGGPNGERLRARIVAQYPAALIDEVPGHLGPLQYRIFDRIYRPSANDPATALFLIGDPKQSIFAFRGGRHPQLPRCAHRHGRAPLSARHQSPFDAGARWRRQPSVRERGSAGRRGRFHVPRSRWGRRWPVALRAGRRARPQRAVPGSVGRCAGADVPATTPRCGPGRRSFPLFAGRCAEHIVGLLNDPQAGFADPERGFVRPAAPADIAVLVRDGPGSRRRPCCAAAAPCRLGLSLRPRLGVQQPRGRRPRALARRRGRSARQPVACAPRSPTPLIGPVACGAGRAQPTTTPRSTRGSSSCAS